MISQTNSSMMKAIAILMVILGHCLNIYFHFNSILCLMLGTGGVAVFLILSGYGLCISYQKKGIQKEYWDHKINKVFIPFWIVTGIWAVIMHLFTAGKSELIISNLLLIDYQRRMDATMWYLSFLILWYLLFFFLFKYQYSAVVKILLLFAFAWFFFDNPLNWFGDCAWQFKRNAFSFPAGVLLGFVSSAVPPSIWKQKRVVLGKLLIALASLLVCIHFYRLHTDEKLPVQIYGLFVFALIFCLCSFAEQVRPIVSFLTGIGSLSYILYLVEGKWFSLISRLHISDNRINACVYFLTIAGFSVIYSVLSGPAKKWIRDAKSHMRIKA